MKIKAKVMPYSPREEITRRGDEYTVRVKEAPIEGRANEAVIKLVAKRFKVPRSAVRIVSGSTGRIKIIEIRTG